MDLQSTTETSMTSFMIGLLDLTNELLFEIIQVLGYGWDPTAFGVTNRRLHALVNPYLYQGTLPNYRNTALEWISETANEAAFAQCLKANNLTYVDKPATKAVPQRAIFLGHDRISERLINSGITSREVQIPAFKMETGRPLLTFAVTRTPKLICYEKYVQTILEWFDLHWAEQSCVK